MWVPDDEVKGLWNNTLCSLFNRGRCAELISYWQFITADKNSMAQAYFTATRKMEEGETNSLGSLFVSLYTEHMLNNECLSQHIL